MTNQDVIKLDERLSRLETTVAKGFHEQGQRMDRFEDRMYRLENKMDVVAESLRGDIRTVLDAVVANTEEMRRTTDAIRKEHEADRRLTRAILQDHSIRIRTLEDRPIP
jgi:uncharacterized coiled-coil protein SlyX